MQKIFSLRSQGHSLADIAATLDKMAQRDPAYKPMRAKAWGKQVVSQILRNVEAYKPHIDLPAIQ